MGDHLGSQRRKLAFRTPLVGHVFGKDVSTRRLKRKASEQQIYNSRSLLSEGVLLPNTWKNRNLSGLCMQISRNLE